MGFGNFDKVIQQVNIVFEKTTIRDRIMTAYLSTALYKKGQEEEAFGMIDKIHEIDNMHNRTFAYALAIAYMG